MMGKEEEKQARLEIARLAYACNHQALNDQLTALAAKKVSVGAADTWCWIASSYIRSDYELNQMKAKGSSLEEMEKKRKEDAINRIRTAQVLLDHNISLLDIGKEFRSLNGTDQILWEACFNNDRPMVGLVVGALSKIPGNETVKDILNRALFYVADPEILKMLLAEKADPRTATKFDGFTPLMEVCLHKVEHFETVELMAKQSDVNAVENEFWGNTALFYAANHGHVKTVELLLNMGADPSLKNKEGEDAKAWAQKSWKRSGEKGCQEVMTLLENYKAQPKGLAAH